MMPVPDLAGKRVMRVRLGIGMATVWERARTQKELRAREKPEQPLGLWFVIAKCGGAV